MIWWEKRKIIVGSQYSCSDGYHAWELAFTDSAWNYGVSESLRVIIFKMVSLYLKHNMSIYHLGTPKHFQPEKYGDVRCDITSVSMCMS